MTTRLGDRNGMGTIARTSTYTRMAFPHIYSWKSAHDERSFKHQTQQETCRFPNPWALMCCIPSLRWLASKETPCSRRGMFRKHEMVRLPITPRDMYASIEPFGVGQGRSVPDLAENVWQRPKRRFTGWPLCTSAPNRRLTSSVQTGSSSARLELLDLQTSTTVSHVNRQRPRPPCQGWIRVSIPLRLSPTQGEGRPKEESLRFPQVFWLRRSFRQTLVSHESRRLDGLDECDWQWLRFKRCPPLMRRAS